MGSSEAREVSDQEIDRKVDQLLGKKYGLMKKLFFGPEDRTAENILFWN